MASRQEQNTAAQDGNSGGGLEKSVRAAVFAELQTADAVVTQLLAAGFSPDQITVVCSDAAKERHFRNFEHQEPAGEHAGNAAVAGTGLGALAGGLAGIAVAGAAGAVPLIIAGAAGLAGGSAMGGFLGTMLTRGTEKEVSNFYDQEVLHDKILVSVEENGSRPTAKLAVAERIFADFGSRPIELPEG